MTHIAIAVCIYLAIGAAVGAVAAYCKSDIVAWYEIPAMGLICMLVWPVVVYVDVIK